jgi:DNA-binding transcriptional LysR family regulator
MEERLKKFAHLVEAGSFTKAAAGLHVSQPALSTSIAKLERELKVRLWLRGVRPLTLTREGAVAYRTAKDLTVQADNLKLRLAELAHERVAISIGMIDSVANALFASDSGLETLEGASVSIVVNNSRYLAEAVERGDLDIAFIAEQPHRLPHALEARPLATEPLVVVASQQRPTPPGKILPNFIAYDQPSNTFRLVNEALKDYGIATRTSFYSTSPELMLRLVQLNKGIAALPYLMVRDQIQAGGLKRLGGKTPWLIRRKIVVLKRRDRDLPLALKHLTRQTAAAIDELLLEAEK